MQVLILSYFFWQRAPLFLTGVFISSHYMCLSFQHYPDYYAIIKEPIDLRTIAQRIQVINSAADWPKNIMGFHSNKC